MDINAPVSTIMSSKLVCANTDMVFSEVKDLFVSHNIHHLPVVDNEKLVGILSYSDMLREGLADSISHGDHSIQAILDDSLSIEKIMSKNPVTVSSSDSIRSAIESFLRFNFHSLPVVDDERLSGIVTTTDILKALL